MGRAGTRAWALAAVVAVVLVPLAGCGGDDGGGDRLSSSSGESGASGASGESGGSVPEHVVAVDTDPADVTALDNTFNDEAIRVHSGTTVRWTNHGRQDHDIAPAEGRDWGAEVGDFAPGDVYEHTFDSPGTYNYYCTIHGTAARGMVGVVVVE
jgi:plastocyanin